MLLNEQSSESDELQQYELQEKFLSKEQYKKDFKQNLGKLIYLSLCCFCLFGAFSPLQSMLAGILADLGLTNLGLYALIILYLCATISNLMTTFVLKKYQINKALAWASAGYISFLIGCFLINSFYAQSSKFMKYILILVLLFCTGLAGLGTGVMWGGQAHYITSITEKEFRGEYFGIQMSVVRASACFGSLIGVIVLRYFQYQDVYHLYYLHKLKHIIVVHKSNINQIQQLKISVLEILEKINDPKLRKLILFYTNQGFVSTSISSLVVIVLRKTYKENGQENYLELTAQTLVILAMAQVAFSYITGKINDVTSHKVVILLCSIACLIALLCTFMQLNKPIKVFSYLMGFTWGIADSFHRVVAQALTSNLFQGDNNYQSFSRIIGTLSSVVNFGLLSLLNQFYIFHFLFIHTILCLCVIFIAFKI